MKEAFEEEREELDERVVDITRVAKVVKGGRTFGFRVTAVVGDNKGQVGFGIGKARTVPDAIGKATERARTYNASHSSGRNHDSPRGCWDDVVVHVFFAPGYARYWCCRWWWCACSFGSAGIHDVLDEVAG